MKKIYTTKQTAAMSDFKSSFSPYRLPFMKTVSLVSVAVFLSNASPVSACEDLVRTGPGGIITVAAKKGGTIITLMNKDGQPRLIDALADGVISMASKQAINGSQLYTLGNMVAATFGSDGRNGGYNEHGVWMPPSFTVNVVDQNGNGTKKKYSNVADALTGVSSSFVNLDKKINYVMTNMAGNDLVKVGAGAVITVAAQKGGSIVDFANAARQSRLLIGVHNGIVSPTSDQAINGSQLYTLGTHVAKFFGGDAEFNDYDCNGGWVPPTFTVKVFDENGNVTKATYGNVADAFTGVSSSFTNIDKRIENVVTSVAGNGLIKQDGTGLITIGGKVNGTKISIANVGNAERILSGVGAGSITATSTDVINGSQFYSMGNVVASYFGGNAEYTNGNWKAPTFTVKGVDQNGNETKATYGNVADALAGVSSSFTNIDKRIENVVTNVAGNDLIKQDATGLITIGGKTNGTKVSIANIDNALRTLSGVGAGSITKTSTDAINGAQIYSISNLVAGYFDDNAGYDANGNWKAPTFTVKVFNKDGKRVKRDYTNIADAFNGVSNSFTNVDKKIENMAANVTGDGLVKQDDTGLISIGGKVNGTKVSIANIDNTARILSGVGAGSITATSTDAINGAQLYSMSNVVASYFGGNAEYKNGNWSAPNFTVKVVDQNGNGVEQHYTNVADALSGVSSSFTNIDKKIENMVVNATGDGLIKQDDTGLITIGGKVNGTKISIASFGNAERVLSGVGAGSITATSTDAINGSQFYSITNAVANYFSGDAGYDENGNWTAPTFTMKIFDDNGYGVEQHYTNVADALSGVSNSFANIDKKIEGVTGSNFIKQNSAGLITIGGSKGGDRIDIANSSGAPRVLTGIKGGDLTPTSTDAVNGVQMYWMSQAFANYFGGNAGYDKHGKWTAPSFTVITLDKDGNEINNNYSSVADAFAGVNSAVKTLNNQISEIKNNPSGGTTKDKESEDENGNGLISEGFPFMSRMLPMERLTRSLDDVDDESDIELLEAQSDPEMNLGGRSLVGGDESDPVIIEVADGEIATGSKQAVTGGQLHDYTEDQMKMVLKSAKEYTDEKVGNLVNDSVNKANAYTDMKFEALSYAVEDVRKEARQAAAIGLAVSNLRYFDDPGSLSVSFGGGLWRGQSAFAFGAGYTSEDGKIRSNLSATSAGGHWGVGGGITLKLK
ncbi:YadA-like family protein [Bartonella harrusi]|uniref:YadA-like family protein n=1 Tax=Bartonella harrusi TaxID=2961895 RepID=A0ABY5ET18_9HYPH|nr:YadA-like family protein [Bartonella harrusi]UTO28532.1 YadA-like family protein [Bartonella harrusi]